MDERRRRLVVVAPLAARSASAASARRLANAASRGVAFGVDVSATKMTTLDSSMTVSGGGQSTGAAPGLVDGGAAYALRPSESSTKCRRRAPSSASWSVSGPALKISRCECARIIGFSPAKLASPVEKLA